MAPFSKAELLNEFREVVYQFARSTSFVFNPETGYQILFGEDKEADAYKFMSPESSHNDINRPFDISRYQVSQSVEQFYDYGLLGLQTFDPECVTGATEWTFAYGLIRDCPRSFLISESLNGSTVSTTKCLTAAKAFFGRLVLDGFDRVHLAGGEEAPEGMLTLSEISVLSGLDERTIRNATLKAAANRLETVVVQSTVYFPRKPALAWLSTKRGFSPTRLTGAEPNETEMKSAFASTADAGRFVQRMREKMGLRLADLNQSAWTAITQADLNALEQGKCTAALDESTLTQVGGALGLNGALFAARVMEVVIAEKIAAATKEPISSAIPVAQELPNVFDLGLTHRTANCLVSAGIQNLGDVVIRTRNEIAGIKGMGKKAMDELDAVLSPRGLAFASSTTH